MQLSVGTDYAIHGLVYLALRPRGQVVYVSEVAKAQNISESYLAKVFQNLARTGLVVSYRGSKGGYMLAKPSEQITFRDILQAVEGPSPLYTCLDQRRDCHIGLDCKILMILREAEQKMYEVLERTTLKDLLDSMRLIPEQVKWLNHSSNLQLIATIT